MCKIAPVAVPNTEKRDLLNRMLSEVRVVRIYLDGRQPDVKLPDGPWRKEPYVILELGLDLPVPIPDLKINDYGVFASLSFGGKSSRCFIPWGRLFSIQDKASGQGVLWKDGLPPELSNRKEEPAPVRHLRLVK